MSLNDPRWGNQGNDDDRRNGDRNRGDNQGPPDLEDVWRDFNQKLSGMLGGKKGGGGGRSGGNGPQMPNFGSRKLGGGIGALLVLLLVLWLASGFYTVDANQRGVVLRFGAHITTTDPGLHWRLPTPIEKHELVDLSGVRTVEIGYRSSDRNQVLREALMLTEDENIVNIQFAIQNGTIFVLEVNPRAARTIPFVSKACGVSLAKIGARCMAGRTLAEQGISREIVPGHFSVKEAVFPFNKFPGVDPILGPEMKSTGEVMGIGRTFAQAFSRSQLAAGIELPRGGGAFFSVRDADKPGAIAVARELVELGFELVATSGTARTLEMAGVPCAKVNKVGEGRPHIVDRIKNGEIDFIVNTTEGKQAIADSFEIRRAALQHKITYSTTLAGARATCMALRQTDDASVTTLQMLMERMDEEGADDGAGRRETASGASRAEDGSPAARDPGDRGGA